MVLAKDEVVVKEWEYATAKKGMVETKETLTVTNKRIVSTLRSSKKIDQQEIFVKDVKRISATHETPSMIPAIIMIVLGALIAILGIANAKTLGPAVAFMMIVGVIFVIVGIVMLGRAAFTLVITLEGFESAGVAVGAVNFLKKASKAKVKIKVNSVVAEEIIDTLGAIVVENK